MLKCERCELSKKRINLVLGRGQMDATILIIGEAPSKSEDLLGQAFTGDSGRLIEDTLQRSGIPLEKCYFTNTLLCRPCDAQNGESREPSEKEIFLCLDNVLNTIQSLKHLKGIILTGKTAKKWYSTRLKHFPQVHIMHPSVLLKQGGKASPFYRDILNTLKEFYNEIS